MDINMSIYVVDEIRLDKFLRSIYKIFFGILKLL